MKQVVRLRRVVSVAIILAFIVVTLGAYTRLTDAGLGCPDWPGCYGHMVVKDNPAVIIESKKAWTEMIHRYAAGTLGLLIFGLAVAVFRSNRQERQLPWGLPLILSLLVLFQAALGMWTVTLKLLPVVVMGHLLGGLLIFTCLCYFWWQLSFVIASPYRSSYKNNSISPIATIIGIFLVFCQIALGGWVSSNYAGIACVGFPQCNGQWLPISHLSKAFNVFSSIGTNYQGGILDNDVRVTIQVIHRLGAYITAAYVLLLSGFIVSCAKIKARRVMAIIAVFLVLLQFTLGVVNVMYLLPLWSAVAHNGLAALLLATMVSLHYLGKQGALHAN